MSITEPTTTSDRLNFDDVTPESLVARAEAIAPTLVPLQAEAEHRTHHCEATHELFKRPGFYRMLTPKRWTRRWKPRKYWSSRRLSLWRADSVSRRNSVRRWSRKVQVDSQLASIELSPSPRRVGGIAAPVQLTCALLEG
jgi:hypothetical protein